MYINKIILYSNFIMTDLKDKLYVVILTVVDKEHIKKSYSVAHSVHFNKDDAISIRKQLESTEDNDVLEFRTWDISELNYKAN